MTSLSGFMVVHNGVRIGYPMVEAALAVVPFVDEFVLAECESNDGTLEVLGRLVAKNPKFRLERRPWPKDKDGGHAIGKAFEDAMGLCRGSHVWMVQADEVWWPDSCRVAVDVVKKNPDKNRFGFPLIHFVGMRHIRPQLHDRCAIRLAKRSPLITVLGDGCALGGGLHMVSAAPHPIHHYGWAFEGSLKERLINNATLWDNPATRHQKERAEKGFFRLTDEWLASQEPYRGGHPEIMLPLVTEDAYRLRPELLR